MDSGGLNVVDGGLVVERGRPHTSNGAFAYSADAIAWYWGNENGR